MEVKLGTRNEEVVRIRAKANNNGGQQSDKSNKVKQLQEESKSKRNKRLQRLRTYNQELRLKVTQLQKQIKQDPMIDDDDDDENEAEEELIHVSQIQSNPLENLIVLDTIFNFLNIHSLGNCRLVCKTWNENAESVLLKKSKIHLGRERDQYKGLESLPTGKIRNLSLICNFLAAPPLHTWIQTTAGQNLKHLELRITSKSFCISIIRALLFDWCPQIEHFGFHANIRLRSVTILDAYYSYQSNHNKLLTTLKSICISGSSLKTSEGCKLFFTEIAQFSPNLIQFKTDHPELLNCFAEKMKNLEVTKPFRNDFDHRHVSLVDILKRASGKLDSLVLLSSIQWVNVDLILGDPNNNINRLIIPRMNVLRKLQIHSLEDYQIGTINFVNNLPNLEELYLGDSPRLSDASRDGMFEDGYDKETSAPKSPLSGNPHLKLKILNIQYGIKWNSSISTIVDCFPNLTSLTLTLGSWVDVYPDAYLGAGRRLLDAAFCDTSVLQSLKQLELNICFEYEIHEISQPLKYLRVFPKLETLKLVNCSSSIDYSDTVKLKILLLHAFKLTKLVMERFKVTNPQEIIDFASNNQIPLDFSS